MKKILVTGANGFIGRGIVKELLDLGNEVIAADFETSLIDNRANRINCNLFDVDNPFGFFGKPDIVLHLAWRNPFLHSSECHMKDLPLHISFLKKMINNGINAVCIMGSMHEVGRFEGEINENTPANPMNDYAKAKNFLRLEIQEYCKNKKTDFKWFRGFYIVSPTEKGNSIFSKITLAEKEGKSSFPFTKGLNKYDFLDYEQFCKYTASATIQDEENGIINICSGKAESLASRVERFILENNYKIKLAYGAFKERPYDSKIIYGNPDKINRILVLSYTKKPKVLVIMASYNGEKYIRQQLDSIFSQKGVDVEVLVRDDGSNDATLQILDEYKNKYNLSWYTGKHLNVSFGFFDLMEKAVSKDFDFIAFSDQDDVWDDDKLKVACARLSFFDVNKPSLYYAGQRLVDENLNFLENHILNKSRNIETRFILSDFAGCTGLFNRALLNKVVQYKPKYMICHDTWVLRICIALNGTVIVDENPHMNYRQHNNNVLGLKHNFKDNIKQFKRYLNVYKVEETVRELIKGYKNEITPKYLKICNWVLNYKNDKYSRKMLLNKSNIDFCKFELNLTYRIKILLKKL